MCALASTEEWPDETSQKGCDLSLNHLALFMANMRVCLHVCVRLCHCRYSHTYANKNMFETNSLWKFILCRLWCMPARSLARFCSVWKCIKWAHKINEPIYYTYRIFSGSILMCHFLQNNLFRKWYGWIGDIDRDVVI